MRGQHFKMSSQQLSSNSLVITVNGLITKHVSFTNLKSALTMLSNNERHELLLLFLEPMGIMPLLLSKPLKKVFFHYIYGTLVKHPAVSWLETLTVLHIEIKVSQKIKNII